MTPTSQTLQLGDLEVNYLEQGEGQPLLLLHGGTATSDSWRHSLPQLARRYRVIAPDTRGHGRTNNPAQQLNYPQLADDVANLVAALGLHRPIVVGYSDGGQTALELALRHESLASALVFGGTVTRPTPKYVETLGMWGFIAPGQLDLDLVAQVFGPHLAHIQTAHAHHYGPDYWQTLLTQLSHLWLELPEYTDRQLGAISAPSLVISGDRDELGSIEECLRLFRLAQNAELALLPGAGHDAVDRKAFWTLVQDFLDRRIEAS